MWKISLDDHSLNGDDADKHAEVREEKKWAWWWTKLLPLLGWIGVILWVASRPKTAPSLRTRSIYAIARGFLGYPSHIAAFFILTVLFQRCLLRSKDREAWEKSEAFSLLGSACVAICSELIQVGIPTRTASLYDLAADFFGVLLAILFMRRKRPGTRVQHLDVG